MLATRSYAVLSTSIDSTFTPVSGSNLVNNYGHTRIQFMEAFMEIMLFINRQVLHGVSKAQVTGSK